MFSTNLHFKTTHVFTKVRIRCYKLIVQQLDVLMELVVFRIQQYVELVLVHKDLATRSQQCPEFHYSRPMQVHVHIV
jgi:hypothetical protein